MRTRPGEVAVGSLVCLDNAQQESFWSTSKTDFYQRHRIWSRAEAIHAASSSIDTVYSHRRRNSALGQLPPVAFARLITTAATQSRLTRYPRNGGDPGSTRLVLWSPGGSHPGGRGDHRRSERLLGRQGCPNSGYSSGLYDLGEGHGSCSRPHAPHKETSALGGATHKRNTNASPSKPVPLRFL